MSVFESFSPKRQAIKKASTVMLIATAITAVVLSLSLVAFKFLWELRGYNQRVILKKEAVRDTLKTDLSVIPNLRTAYEQLEKGKVNSETILDALPSKYDFPALGTSIEYLVSRSGMTLRNFTGKDQEGTAVNTDPKPKPVEMPISISVEGSYESLVKLIDNFNRSTRPIKINSIKIGGTDQVLKADIQLVSYYQPAVSLKQKAEVVK